MNQPILKVKKNKKDQFIEESENELRLKMLCYRFMLKNGQLKNTALIKKTKKKIAVKLTEISNKRNIISSLPAINVKSDGEATNE